MQKIAESLVVCNVTRKALSFAVAERSQIQLKPHMPKQRHMGTQIQTQSPPRNVAGGRTNVNA